MAAPERACLFAGTLQPPLERVAPYLVNLTASRAMAEAWRGAWGQHWGILCVAQADLETLRRHFRQFLQARLPSGQIALFRFYDPRVLRIYLPTCSAEEVRAWFACVEEFRLDSAGARATLLFRLGPAGLETESRAG